MTTKWTAPETHNVSPTQPDEELLDKTVVIFLQGKNVFGDRIYSYVELTLRNLKKLKETMDSSDDFSPSDFGTVIAAGTGYPSDELKAEMAATYNMMDIAPPPPPTIPQPKVWDDENGDEPF